MRESQQNMSSNIVVVLVDTAYKTKVLDLMHRLCWQDRLLRLGFALDAKPNIICTAFYTCMCQ